MTCRWMGFVLVVLAALSAAGPGRAADSGTGEAEAVHRRINGMITVVRQAAGLDLGADARLALIDKIADSLRDEGHFGTPKMVWTVPASKSGLGGKMAAAAYEAGPSLAGSCMAQRPDVVLQLFLEDGGGLIHLGDFYHIVDDYTGEESVISRAIRDAVHPRSYPHGVYGLTFLTLLGCGTSIHTTYLMEKTAAARFRGMVKFNSRVTTSRREVYECRAEVHGPGALDLVGTFDSSPRDGAVTKLKRVRRLVRRDGVWVEQPSGGPDDRPGALDHHWYSWSEFLLNSF